ncbi:MAG TPA: spore germination protein GerW family protein [Candidatus Limnocylindrales bacterium]|nr:spore germination protein GerW family protein [Candidatus Limnocylindrales bacterium]
MLDSVQEVIDSAQAGKVFGAPIERDGMTVVPVAKVRGGGGAGGAAPTAGERAGEAGGGAGVGVMTKPLGVFVIRDGKVSWQPALDVNRVILGGQVVLALALLTLRAYLKKRRR